MSAERGERPSGRALSFGSVASARRFDLVYAAAAWHWTDPATRWTRAADLLVPGGVLALFGRPGELRDPDLAAAVAEVERRFLPDDDATERHPWSIDEITAVACSADVTQVVLPSVLVTTADDHLGRLATVSAYLVLDPEVRAEALRQVRAVLSERFEIDGSVHLSLARLR